MEKTWEQCAPDIQCLIVAYNQTREHDETEHDTSMVKAMVPRMK